MKNHEAFQAIQKLIDLRNEGYKDENLNLKTYIEDDDMYIEGHNAPIVIGSMYNFLSPMVLHIIVISDRKVRLFYL